ncbi:MAG: hypothetical protein R3C60_08035 [Parvularculaceae bacterium]
MRTRRIFIGPLIGTLGANLLAFSAAAETSVIRPPDRAADQGLIVRACSRKPLIIDLGPMPTAKKSGSDHVLIIYPPADEGWASKRLLSRFDVEGAPPRRDGCAY